MIEESWNARLGPMRVELIRTGYVWKGAVDWDYGFTFSLDSNRGRGFGIALTGGTGHHDLEEWEQPVAREALAGDEE